MSDYWIQDQEGRVLGPVGLAVLLDLAVAGRMTDIERVSFNGRDFRPLAAFPELLATIDAKAPEKSREEEARAVRRIRQWLSVVRHAPAHDVFQVVPEASFDLYKRAFFEMVPRFSPDRLPDGVSDELREACEDGFLFLAEKIVDMKRYLGE